MPQGVRSNNSKHPTGPDGDPTTNFGATASVLDICRSFFGAVAPRFLGPNAITVRAGARVGAAAAGVWGRER